MLHRLFNKGGHWHRPASLDPSAWTRFEFEMSWTNLNKMFSLRNYYVEIAPPFSKQSVGRTHEIEMLHDDIVYYHVRKSWYRFAVWVLFTTFIIDMDDLDNPKRHPMTDDQSNNDFPYITEGFMP